MARCGCRCVGSGGVSAARRIPWASWAEVAGRGDPDSPPSISSRCELAHHQDQSGGHTPFEAHPRVTLRLKRPREGGNVPRPPSEIRAALEMGLWCHCSSGGGTWSKLPPRLDRIPWPLCASPCIPPGTGSSPPLKQLITLLSGSDRKFSGRGGRRSTKGKRLPGSLGETGKPGSDAGRFKSGPAWLLLQPWGPSSQAARLLAGQEGWTRGTLESGADGPKGACILPGLNPHPCARALAPPEDPRERADLGCERDSPLEHVSPLPCPSRPLDPAPASSAASRLALQPPPAKQWFLEGTALWT